MQLTPWAPQRTLTAWTRSLRLLPNSCLMGWGSTSLQRLPFPPCTSLYVRGAVSRDLPLKCMLWIGGLGGQLIAGRGVVDLERSAAYIEDYGVGRGQC